MDAATNQYLVDFEPVGRRDRFRPDQTLLDAARQLGVDLISVCGGAGACGRCKLQLLAGELSPPAAAEKKALSPQELADGYRLACLAYPRSDCKLRVPPDSLSTPMRTQVEGLEAHFAIQPAVHSLPLSLVPPSLSHPLADDENLQAALRQAHQVGLESLDLAVLQHLSDHLREWGWQCQAQLRGGELIGIGPAASSLLGLAVDLGSTKVAGYLVNLETGQTLAARGIMNPQISYGEDIVSRISYAMKSAQNRRQMQALIVDGLNQLADDLCAEAGFSRQQIMDSVIVGNTAMHHLLLGLPTRQLARAPYVPAVARELDVKARDLDLDFGPGSYVHLLPNIAGYVGADHVAMLLGTADQWAGKTAIALDIGTNTEISLVTASGQIKCLSCASGPAFEGYHIKNGSRAKTGAIERVQVTPTDVFIQTIEGAPASGICGSGILDAVAQLQLAGVLGSNGRMQAGSHPRLSQNEHGLEFGLVDGGQDQDLKSITVTQSDIREIQLAKAAIQTGIQVLVAESNIRVEDLDEVIIAGAFGSYIDVPNAVAMGMFPDLPLERFTQVGNAAGIGAKMALLSTAARARAADLQARIDYVELGKYPRFANIYARNCQLKPYASLPQ